MSLLALQRDFRSWLISEAPDAAARMGNRAAPGLAVYINNYRSQLMASLAESYEAVHAWLGDKAFEAAAATHIDRLPPHSWTLDDYALDFPITLAKLHPDDPEVVDLARLERDLGLAFVGPDSAPLDRSLLAKIDWDRAFFVLVPTLSMPFVTTNAAAILSAINAGMIPPAAKRLREPASNAVWRHEFSPAFRTLERLEAQALSMAREGKTFAQICALVAGEIGKEDGPARAGSFLGQWLGDGMIQAIGT